MTPLDIGRLRLHNQQIAHTQCTTPAEVVAWLGAIQGQDYAGAKWSMGLRLPNGTDAGIEHAIAEKSIVRTWPMRGTLHFVAAADARWLVALVAPRSIANRAARHRQLELDEAIINGSKKAFGKALEGERQLTRNEMYMVLDKAGISTAGQRGYHILWRAAQDGLICFGSPRGKQQTFVLLDEWTPGARKLDREQALGEIAKRYFTSRGPARVQDFAWWLGTTLTDASAGVNMVKSQLIRETFDRQDYWMAPHLSMPRNMSAAVHLLPGFDEFVLGYKDRSAVLDPKFASRICPGGNGVFFPTIVVDGQIEGLWKRTGKKDTVTVSAYPFIALSKVEQRGFAKTARRYAQFLGAEVTL